MENTFKEFASMDITVMGLGSFGGGIGAAKFLAMNGAHVTVTDIKSEHELSESVEKLQGLDIRFVLGRHEIKDFTDARMVVVNPAVPRDSEYIRAARNSGTWLRTEIGLFIERCPAQICGVTGSNGKTTTVSMLKSILDRSGKTHWIGGNIGGSLLSDLGSISPEDIVVLELSSFQLEWLNELAWSPHIAAVLNIMPNHLDRYGTLEKYTEAKATILDYQKTSDSVILVRDDPGSRSLLDRARGRAICVGTDLDKSTITIFEEVIVRRKGKNFSPILDTARLKVPGRHMVYNAMAAAACACEMGIRAYAITEGLASYNGLPHRLEFIGEYNGVSFFNDSKATTPEAAAAGAIAFNSPVVQIIGGYDKEVEFDEMATQMKGCVRMAALIGQTAPVIARSLEKAGIEYSISGSLEEAFEKCVSQAREGDIILLSPGCASYDMFSDYEERGDIFRDLVKAYSGSQT